MLSYIIIFTRKILKNSQGTFGTIVNNHVASGAKQSHLQFIIYNLKFTERCLFLYAGGGDFAETKRMVLLK